jgi:chromate transporter
MRRSKWLSTFLDAINVAAVALMAAVLLLLGRATLTDWPAALIALLAGAAVFRFKISSFWLILGGAGLGYLFYLLGLVA